MDSLIREIEGQTNLSIQTFSSDDKQRVNGVKVKCEGIFKAEILFDDSNLSQNSNLIQVLRVAVFAYNEEVQYFILIFSSGVFSQDPFFETGRCLEQISALTIQKNN